MKYYLDNDGAVKSFADLINGDYKVVAKVYDKKEFTKQFIKIGDERRYAFDNEGDKQVGPAVRVGSVFFAAIKKFLERQIHAISNATQVLKMYHEDEPLFVAILENKDEHRFVMNNKTFIGEMCNLFLDSLFSYLQGQIEASQIKLFIFPFVTVVVTIENSEPVFYFVE